METEQFLDSSPIGSGVAATAQANPDNFWTPLGLSTSGNVSAERGLKQENRKETKKENTYWLFMSRLWRTWRIPSYSLKERVNMAYCCCVYCHALPPAPAAVPLSCPALPCKLAEKNKALKGMSECGIGL